MRLWLGSHLGWNLMISNFLDDTNRMLKVGSVYPSRGRVKCHAYARACSLQQGNWNSAWQISSFPQPLWLLPGIHRVLRHGQDIHPSASEWLSAVPTSRVPLLPRMSMNRDCSCTDSAETFVQSTHVAKQATTWKGSSLSSLTVCISSLFDNCWLRSLSRVNSFFLLLAVAVKVFPPTQASPFPPPTSTGSAEKRTTEVTASFQCKQPLVHYLQWPEPLLYRFPGSSV